MVDEPSAAIWGGVVAAPAFAQIAKFDLQYLEVPPDAPDDEHATTRRRSRRGERTASGASRDPRPRRARDRAVCRRARVPGGNGRPFWNASRQPVTCLSQLCARCASAARRRALERANPERAVELLRACARRLRRSRELRHAWLGRSATRPGSRARSASRSRDRLARAGEAAPAGRAPGAPPSRCGERAGERGRPRPPLLGGRGVGTACAAPRTATSARPASASSAASLPRRRTSENGPGRPGGGIGMPSSRRDRVEHDAEPRVLLARAPDGERDPAARAQDPPISRDGARRVGHEHQPFAAEDDVVGPVRLVDLLEVELARAHVREAERLGPGRARSRSSRARRPRARPRRPARRAAPPRARRRPRRTRARARARPAAAPPARAASP